MNLKLEKPDRCDIQSDDSSLEQSRTQSSIDTMNWIQRPKGENFDGAKVLISFQEMIGPPALIANVFILVFASFPWQEEPLLMDITPNSRLVNHVAWRRHVHGQPQGVVLTHPTARAQWHPVQSNLIVGWKTDTS
eukprot:m.90777 g.90777  ORF g.90777 m.90777 type:complete len:135 (-) comp51099_c0_seq55:912-1316(-)